MAATIHVFNPPLKPLALYLRLGHSGHRVIEDRHAAGRVKIDRAVVDAAHFEAQKDLVHALRESGVELSLDTKSAEMATLGGLTPRVQALKWASKRPHSPDDFTRSAQRDFVAEIAEYAVAGGMNRVLCPTHSLDGALSPWLRIDAYSCELLRAALDSAGGSRIAIDYPLLVSYEAMRDEASRTAMMAALASLPYENLWLRISGFGSSATAAGVRRYINAAWGFRDLKKPVVADGVGGLVGEALLAFGAAGAIAHGVAEKERFSSRDWIRPPKNGGGGGGRRIYLPDIDVYVKGKTAADFFAVHGAKALLACNDMACCPRGVEDMLSGWQRHFLYQRHRQIAALNKFAPDNLARSFLSKRLEVAGRAARQAERLRMTDPVIESQLQRKSRMIDNTIDVLEDLNETATVPVAIRTAKVLPLSGASGVAN